MRLPQAICASPGYLALVLALAAGPSLAQEPPPLPPPAQPGAQLPRTFEAPLPIQREDFVFRIPPVIERPLGVDEGARVFVRGFEIRGILQDPEAPELEAQVRRTVEEEFQKALALVEELRIERQQLGLVGPDGFTEEERRRVMVFMQRAIRDLDPQQRAEEYQRLVNELGLARLEREQGLTIGQIEQISDAVTQLYRDRGFFLARAIIPAQEVEQGIVTIQVLEGRLGDTHVANNEMYRTDMLRRPFVPLEGKLLTVPQVEAALFKLSDYPGLSAFGTFRPGEEVGTADVVVNVTREDRYKYTMRLDNYGTKFTGQDRAAVGVDIHNFSNIGDRVSLTAMKAFNPHNTLLGQFTYELPVGVPHRKFRLELARNAFDISGVGFAGVGFAGLSRSATVALEHAAVRGRNFNLYFQGDFSRKRGETLQGGQVLNQDDLAVVGAQVRFDQIHSPSNSLISGFFRIDFGLDSILDVPTNALARNPPPGVPRPSRAGAVPEFYKLTAGYSRLIAFSDRSSALFRLSGQYTSDPLTSLEQFSVGGPHSVRAAPTATFLGDKGVFASLDWFIRAPFFAHMSGPGGRTWGEWLTVNLFTDHTIAYNNTFAREEERKMDISGYGAGLTVTFPQPFLLKIQHARLRGGERLGTGVTDPTRIEEAEQTWIEFSYGF